MSEVGQGKKHFGEVPGVGLGTHFPNRKALSAAGVHTPQQQGISGSPTSGANSIVLSGGYVDDEDHGDVILYTGQGGRDRNSRRQVSDQDMSGGNGGLRYSWKHKLPVRVIRGHGHKSPWSPAAGYVYSGLYRVTAYWPEQSIHGPLIWRFRLEAVKPLLGDTSSRQTLSLRVAESTEEYRPERIKRTSSVIRRRTHLAEGVKALYGHHCQVCGIRLETPGGNYAEAAHIRPLGSGHKGPDEFENLLCLCPNHHVLLDRGAWTVSEDMKLIGTRFPELRLRAEHPVALAHLRYHRERIYGRP